MEKEEQKTSVGIDPRIVISISWLFWIVALIFFILENKDTKLRIQILQVLLYKLILYIILTPLFLLSLIPFILVSLRDNVGEGFGFLFICISCILMLFVLFVQWVVPLIGIVSAMQNKELKLPLIYNLAERFLVSKTSG